MVFDPKIPHGVYDSALSLKASAAVAATAAGSLIVDVGQGELWANLEIDVTTLVINDNDETYTIVLQGSNTASFGTASDIVELMAVNLGDKVPKITDADADDVVGHYVKPFCNIGANGIVYRYLRIYTVVAGTTPSITYSAFISK